MIPTFKIQESEWYQNKLFELILMNNSNGSTIIILELPIYFQILEVLGLKETNMN